jgi:alpha-tubulin suppressor-like RCC1 family protein
MSWTSTLGDSAIRNRVDQAIADSKVGYQEMLGLFQGAAAGGINATEFADLQAVYTNARTMFDSDYLRAISFGVIYANPANAKWWGGAKATANVIDLGNMTAGMTEQKAGLLVDKWFLGKDLPMPVVGGDTANNKASSGVYNYVVGTGPLFVGGATAVDVNQGNAGTCYLVAALGSIAHVNSAYITDAFIDNGNGTFGVRFYLNDAPVYVTIDKSVPVSTGNSIAVSGNATRSPGGELWVTLYEKAYAQLNTQADINNTKNWAGENSYQTVEGGWANPIRQITNLSYKYYSSYYGGVPDNYKSGEFTANDPLTYKQTIIDALNSGAIGWLGSFGQTTDAGNGLRNLVAGHAFMILGYEAATDQFVIRNPWGGAGGGYNAEFKMTIGEFWNTNVKGIVAISDPAAAATKFGYTVATNATAGAAVTEGGEVLFTLTRSGTGMASTVYVATTGITAGAGDFKALNKVAVNFAAYETTVTVPVATFTDNLVEATETFRLDVYESVAATTSLANAVAHVADKASQAFTYAVASTAGSVGAAVVEGAPVTFTVTRSGTGTASTVYLSTVAGTAGNADITALNKMALAFASYETVKTVTVATLQDSLAEEVEAFTLAVHEAPDSTAPAATALGHVKDATLPTYGYIVQSSAGSAAEAVTEGGAITFSIWRSGSGTESTVHLSTRTASAGGADFAGFEARAITFAPYQTVATISVATNQDWWLETPEYFLLDLYLRPNDSFYATSGIGFMKDNPTLEYNYTIANNSPEASPVGEGGQVTFTVTRNGTGTASTVYLSTVAGTAGAADYAGMDKVPVAFAEYETVKTVTVNLLTDSAAEDTEHFWVNLYRNIADSGESGFSQAFIKNVAAANFTYAVASTAGAIATAIGEGGGITFTVTRSGTGAASTVYVSTTDSTASAGSDFEDLNALEVTFKADETVRTVTVGTYQDTAVEGDEYFWLDLYTSYADSQTGSYAAFASGYIQDVAAASFSYTVSSNATPTAPMGEGGSIVFTITRNATGSASTVYVATSDSTAWAGADYEGIAAQAVTFRADETVKTVTVATYQDTAEEGDEYFWLDLYTSYADSQSGSWATFASGYIANVAAASFDYTVSSSAPEGAPVDEGGSVTFTITRSGTGAASTVYVSTSGSTALEGVDYQPVAAQAVEFAAGETVKTVTVATFQDSENEGTERFWLDLYKSLSDTQSGTYSAFASGHIANVAAASFEYTVSSSAPSDAPVDEGGSVTFTITRSGTGAASTVYVSTTASSASPHLDYQAVTAQAVEFAAGETVKTVTVATFQDAESEPTERFWLDLYKSLPDSQSGAYSAFAAGNIRDVTATPTKYSVVSSTSVGAPASEGGNVTFTITRDRSTELATVYVTAAGSSATEGSDFEALSAVPVIFDVGQVEKTVSVATYPDSITEGTETFWLDVYTSLADAQTGNWATFAGGHIMDGAVGPGAGYSVASSASLTAPGIEGDDITFTITRSDTAAEALVYVLTRDLTAQAFLDFSGRFWEGVAFAAGEATRTVTVSTFNDAVAEGMESFSFELFTSIENAIKENPATSAAAFLIDRPGGALPFGAMSSMPPQPPGEVGGVLTAADIATASFRGHVGGAFANDFAFAAIKADGGVVTWGQKENGGDSAAVAGQLTNVVEVFSNTFAFAALRGDGSVVTWGNASLGGNSAAVAASLDGTVDVTGVFSTSTAFAALRADGSVVTWGDKSNGGSSAAVAGALNGTIDVVGIASTMSAFAALRQDGSVTTWGFEAFGGDSAAVATQLSGAVPVVGLAGSGSAFAALRQDGSVVTWGNAGDGGDSKAVAASLDGTVDAIGLAATTSAFAAIRSDGSVVTWGANEGGGNSAAVAAQLDGKIDVVGLAATDQAFAARRADGSVVAWGNAASGGSTAAVAAALDGTVDVIALAATSSAFAALRADGTVVSWGHGPFGGELGDAGPSLTNVVSLTATDQAFAARRSDGSVVTWGGFLGGGNSADVKAQLDGTVDVVQILGGSQAFAALRQDGSVVSWGDQSLGGAQGAAAASLTTIAQLGDGAFYGIAPATQLVGENGVTASFTLTRTGALPAETVFVSTTETEGAANSGDYAALSGKSFAFAAGQMALTINVAILNDTVAESAETFGLLVQRNASDPASVFLAKATATILDEDNPAEDDVAISLPGDEAFDLGAGTDTVVFSQARENYQIGILGSIVRVEGPDGRDELRNVELLKFGEFAVITAESMRGKPATEELYQNLEGGTLKFGLPTRYVGPNALDYILPATNGSDVLQGTSRNDFANLGAGNDAASMGGGDDVVDGGGGNNFLTGGTGRDTFFIDGRDMVPVWSCITDWQPGEALTLWGWQAGVSVATWSDSDGLPGFLGATMYADMDGNGLVETAITWTGIARADLPAARAFEVSGIGVLYFN